MRSPEFYKVSDEEIATAFGGASFGPVVSTNHRHFIAQALLKKLAGYACGGTIERIMRELGLLSASRKITTKGNAFIYSAFRTRSLTEERQYVRD